MWRILFHILCTQMNASSVDMSISFTCVDVPSLTKASIKVGPCLRSLRGLTFPLPANSWLYLILWRHEGQELHFEEHIMVLMRKVGHVYLSPIVSYPGVKHEGFSNCFSKYDMSNRNTSVSGDLTTIIMLTCGCFDTRECKIILVSASSCEENRSWTGREDTDTPSSLVNSSRLIEQNKTVFSVGWILDNCNSVLPYTC